MALLVCPDCKTKVSDRASFCPKCGRAYTLADHERAWKKNQLKWKIGLPMLGLLLLLGLWDKNTDDSRTSTSGSAYRAEDIPIAAPEPSAPSYTGPDAGYQSLIANIWVGTKLYLRIDKSFIGTVVTVEDDHTFPDGTRRAGVLVRYKDGSTDWLPRKMVTRIYVTRP